MSNKDQFKNLILMAAADGKIREAELRLLSDRAMQWGITDDEFEDAIQYAMSKDAVLHIPNGREERFALLKDLMRMMAADGEMAPSERKLFAHAASALEVGDEELNRLIDEVVAEP